MISWLIVQRELLALGAGAVSPAGRTVEGGPPSRLPGEVAADEFGRLLQGEDRQAPGQRERVSIALEEIERLAPPAEAGGEPGSWVLEAGPTDLPGHAERIAVTLREIPRLRLPGRDAQEMPGASLHRPPAEGSSPSAPGVEAIGVEAIAGEPAPARRAELPIGEGRSPLGSPDADAVLLPVDAPDGERPATPGQPSEPALGEGWEALGTPEAVLQVPPASVPGADPGGIPGQPIDAPIGEGRAFLEMPEADPESPPVEVPAGGRGVTPEQATESLVGGKPEAGAMVDADHRALPVDLPGEERAELPEPVAEPSPGEAAQESLGAATAGAVLEAVPGRGLALLPDLFRSVDVALRGSLGLAASGEQVHRLWSLMSPEQQIAFLTRPSQVLPELRSLPSTAFDAADIVVGADLRLAHGLFTAFDDLLAELPDLARVRQFFDGLTGLELLRLVTERASEIGGLAGAPFEVRYAANEQLVVRDWLRLREAADPDAERGAAQLAGLLGGGSRLLEYALPEGLLPGGRLGAPRAVGGISQVFGDLSAARRVAFLLPGTSTSLDGLPRVADQATRLYDLAQGAGGRESAVVTYFGLRTPLAPGAERMAAQLQQAQQQAAQQVRELVTGLVLPSGVRTTMVGYSVGSSVVKQLVKTEGVKTDAVVLLGLPRRELRKVPREVAGQQSDLYGNSTAGEPIEKIDEEWLAALARAEKAAKQAETAPVVAAIEGQLVDEADNYLAAGSRELQQVAAIVNDGDLAADAWNLAAQFVGS